MSLQGKFWLVGFFLAVAFAALLAGQPAGRAIDPLLGVVLWVVIGGVGEIVAFARRSASAPRPTGPPADGRVGIAPVAGVRGEPCAADPRFRRLVGLDEGADAGAVREDTPQGPRPLLGRVVIFSLFLGRDGRGWSEDEVAQAHKALIRAGEWIEREAIRWRAPVNLDLADTYVSAEDDAPRGAVELALLSAENHDEFFEADAAANALISASRAAARLGFPDAATLTGDLGRRVAAEARVWLLHVRAAGRSFVIPEFESPWPGLNLAVCYAREADSPAPLTGPPFPDPVTFVHELLHLFGAEDKYDVPLHAFPPGQVSERDVMALYTTALSRLRVDPRTATEIGWAAGA